jgi:hypothetical protein
MQQRRNASLSSGASLRLPGATTNGAFTFATPPEGASDELPGVELRGAHMLPPYPSELHAVWKRTTQIEEDPH